MHDCCVCILSAGDSEDEEVPLVIDDEMEVSQPADQLSDENNE